jgi:hypothetical protein
MRTFIEKAMNRHGVGVPPTAVVWLSEVDQFMRSFTEEVADWNPDADPGGGWWSTRLPIRGPVRAGWWAE